MGRVVVVVCDRLVWPSVEGAPVDEIAEVMDMITMQIDLSNIFITNTAIGRYLQQEKKPHHATTGTSGSLHDSLLGSGVFDSIALDAVPGGDGEQSTTANANANANGKRQRGKRVKCVYELRGMICYYGQHYNCYFNSPATGQWYAYPPCLHFLHSYHHRRHLPFLECPKCSPPAPAGTSSTTSWSMPSAPRGPPSKV